MSKKGKSKYGGYDRKIPKSEFIKIRVTPEFKEALRLESEYEKGTTKNWSQSDVLHIALANELMKRSRNYQQFPEELKEAIRSNLMP